jgi:hypothetical protein
MAYTQGQLQGFQKAQSHIDSAHGTIHGIGTGVQTTLEAAATHYQTTAGATVQTSGATLLDVVSTLKADLALIGEKIGTNSSNYGNAGQQDLTSANKIASIINNLPV